MGVVAGGWRYDLGNGVPVSLSHRHDRAVCVDPMVEVFPHVLQASRGSREARVQGKRHGAELADADPRRSRTAEKTFHGIVARRSDANGTWHQARSATPLLK